MRQATDGGSAARIARSSGLTTASSQPGIPGTMVFNYGTDWTASFDPSSAFEVSPTARSNDIAGGELCVLPGPPEQRPCIIIRQIPDGTFEVFEFGASTRRTVGRMARTGSRSPRVDVQVRSCAPAVTRPEGAIPPSTPHRPCRTRLTQPKAHPPGLPPAKRRHRRHHRHPNQRAACNAKYVRIAEAPARLMESSASTTADFSSNQPRSTAAMIIAYSPLTW